MEMIGLIIKIVTWALIVGIGCDTMIQRISYSFYKGDKQIKPVTFIPDKIQINDRLTGYGYNLDLKSDHIIIMFGGSNYIAYNTIGMFGGYYNCPVFAVDYYGTQDSNGKMSLKTMQKSSIDLYDWILEQYPEKNITIIGHSYGAGMAAYLASVRNCDNLILLAAYRDLSDLYNKIIPVFWGPAKVFISNNIDINEYAKHTTCNVYVFGSNADKTLSAALQEEVSMSYEHAKLSIYEEITHEDYLIDERIIGKIKEIIN